MSLLIEVLRKAEEGPSPPPPPAPPQAPAFTLEALRDPPPAPPPAQTAPASPRPDSPSSASPRARSAAALGAGLLLGGGLLLGSWRWSERQALPPAAPPPIEVPRRPPVPPAAPEGEAAAAPRSGAPEEAAPAPPAVPSGSRRSARRAPLERSQASEPPRFRPGTPNPAAPPPLLAAAYDAYLADDLAHARTLYRQALDDDPASLDALDGLGAIALRQNQSREAEAFFLQALQVSPGDPVALAGLSQLAAPPRRAETPLRQSLAEHPEALAAQVALGAALARQQRWAEARQAYRQAQALAPDNPDLAYNLAVSLDHLGHHGLAATSYRRALELAATFPSHFAPAGCAARLQALTSLEPER